MGFWGRLTGRDGAPTVAERGKPATNPDAAEQAAREGRERAVEIVMKKAISWLNSEVPEEERVKREEDEKAGAEEKRASKEKEIRKWLGERQFLGELVRSGIQDQLWYRPKDTGKWEPIEEMVGGALRAQTSLLVDGQRNSFVSAYVAKDKSGAEDAKLLMLCRAAGGHLNKQEIYGLESAQISGARVEACGIPLTTDTGDWAAACLLADVTPTSTDDKILLRILLGGWTNAGLESSEIGTFFSNAPSSQVSLSYPTEWRTRMVKDTSTVSGEWYARARALRRFLEHFKDGLSSGKIPGKGLGAIADYCQKNHTVFEGQEMAPLIQRLAELINNPKLR